MHQGFAVIQTEDAACHSRDGFRLSDASQVQSDLVDGFVASQQPSLGIVDASPFRVDCLRYTDEILAVLQDDLRRRNVLDADHSDAHAAR